MPRSYKVLVALLVSVLLVGIIIGACSGSLPAATTAPQATTPEKELGVFEEAWDILFRDYVGKENLDPEALKRAAIEGMLRALDDPYTSYIDPEHYSLAYTHLMGKFEGIGAVLAIEDGQLTIVSPVMGAPAERAGIRVGDRVLEIDGQSTEGLNLLEAVIKIRGPKGTQVTLTILHKDEEAPVGITITRDDIQLKSVSVTMLLGNIAHIRVTYFSGETSAEFITALNQAQNEGARALVLDLRNNPGGPLEAAVAVASQFLQEGLVLYTVDGEGQRQDWEVMGGALAPELPLAVLVNEGSASASEVLAGAIQDHQRGPLIGVKTYGKGSINLLHHLSDGSGLYITIGRWYTPIKDRLIEGQGLAPDPGYEVELTEEDAQEGGDPQLDRALEYLRSGL